MSDVTTTRVNVTLGSGKAIHAGSKMTVDGRQYAASPDCGGNRATERYMETTREVTCRKCLKALAAEAQKEAEYQDRLEASLAPATESHDLGYVHVDEQAAADAQPEEIKAAREEAGAAARGAAYAAQLLAGMAQAAPVAAVQDEAEQAQDDPDAITVTVDLVTPTKGLVLAGDHAGTVLHTAKREQQPGAGWEAENEHGERVASRMSCVEAAVAAWAMAEGLTGRLAISVCHEYQQTGQRDG